MPFAVSAQDFAGVARAREDLPALDGEGTVAAIIDSGINTTMPDVPGPDGIEESSWSPDLDRCLPLRRRRFPI